ncbi:MAG: hypothetical protein IJ297_03630 [Clostridia bacterium]|nr:hypothetical protein [Clostridia bacterium]
MTKFKRTIAGLIAVVMLLACTGMVASANGYVTIYTEDGRTAQVLEHEVAAYEAVGWHRNYNEVTTTLYSPDGQTLVVYNAQVASYVAVGWYTMPVTRLYTIYGDTLVVYTYEVPNYLAIGWSDNINAVQTTLYDQNGNAITVYNAQVPAYEAAGWSKTKPYVPVTNYYNSDIPDFGSVTGAALIEADPGDDNSVIYSYAYNYAHMEAYRAHLVANGWVYQGDDTFEDGTPYYAYKKGNAYVSFSIEWKYSQIWVYVLNDYRYVESTTTTTTTTTNTTTSNYDYYSRSNAIPTYTSVTGVTSYDSFSNADGAVYAYLVGEDDNGPVDYIKALSECGWEHYKTEEDGEYKTIYYYKKGSEVMSVTLMVDFSIPSIIVRVTYLYQ